MGDVLSLVEEARKTVDVDEAKKFAEKLKKGKGFEKMMRGIKGFMPGMRSGLFSPAQMRVGDVRLL